MPCDEDVHKYKAIVYELIRIDIAWSATSYLFENDFF